MNTRKESIVKTKRTLLRYLAVFPWLSGCAHTEACVPTIPPWRSFRWDISKKGSVIEQEFIVTEHRSYDFDLEFHHNGLPDDWKKFIGTGGDIFLTRDQVNPRRVRDEDVGGDGRRLYELYHKGELVIKSADPGVIVPIHIRVEKIDEVSGNKTLLADKTVDTEARYRGGGGIVARGIWGVALKPGRYKVSAETLKDVPLPPAPNAETYTALGIVYYAKVNPTKE